MPYLKDLPETSIQELLDTYTVGGRSFTVPSNEVEVRFNGQTDDQIVVGDASYPLTGEGLTAIAAWVDLPPKLVTHWDPDLTGHVLNTLLGRSEDDVAIDVTDNGILDAYAPSAHRIDPRRVMEIAARVIDPSGQVVSFRKDTRSYGFEVITRPSVIAEAEAAVGDISHGGLRFGHEFKDGYMPWVQPFIYRLVCTNGLEVPDETLKVSSEGRTVEGVLESLEDMARLAFERVDADIEAFYELKNHPVENPERTLVRIGREQGISAARLRSILENFPEYLDDNGQVSEFDLVNAITNEANRSSMDSQFNAQRKLQRAGGTITFSHASRCPTCAAQIASV